MSQANSPMTVTGIGLKIGGAFPDRVRRETRKIAAKYLGRMSDAEACFSTDGGTHRCRLNLHVAGFKTISAMGEGDHPTTAFSKALDKAGKQLRRLKRRVVDDRARGGSHKVVYA